MKSLSKVYTKAAKELLNPKSYVSFACTAITLTSSNAVEASVAQAHFHYLFKPEDVRPEEPYFCENLNGNQTEIPDTNRRIIALLLAAEIERTGL